MSFTEGGVYYEVNLDGVSVAVAGMDVLENVVIPSIVRSPENVPYNVTSIKAWCLDGAGMTSITLPTSITSIGNYALRNCPNLTTVTLPEGLISIGIMVLNNCLKLKSITLPASLAEIKSSAFENSTNLSTVTFLGNKPIIESPAFNNIKAGAKGYYSGTEWTANQVIAGLTMLPESDRPVYPYIEVNCNAPTTSVNGSSTIINFEFDPLTGGAVTEYKLFNSTNTGTPLTLSSSTSSSLSYSITTPPGNTAMSFYIRAYNGDNAVSPNQSVAISVTIAGFLPTTYTDTDGVTYYDLNTSNLTAAVAGSYSTGAIVIPPTLVVQGYPFNVTSIKAWCLDGARMTSITLPTSITSIGNYALRNCPNLTTVTLPEGLISIGIMVLSSCPNLESITLPASLAEIKYSAFETSTNLSTVTFLGNKPTIESPAFNNIKAGAKGYYIGSGWTANQIIAGLTMEAQAGLPSTSGGGGGNAAVPVAPVVVPVAPTAPGSSPVACLPAGQRILTASGWRAVETLRHGDMVITDKGTAVPATIYSSTIKTTAATAPITIPANLFGRNAPAAPIRLSPMHAVRMTKNVWEFPYNLLRSRDGVTQDAPGASVTYYHVALPHFLRDNMVLEGGVVAESYGAPYAKANGIQGTKMYTYSERLGGYTRIGEGSIKKTA